MSGSPWTRRLASADWSALWEAHTESLELLREELANLRDSRTAGPDDEYNEKLTRVTNAIKAQVAEGRLLAKARDVGELPDEDLDAQLRARIRELLDRELKTMPIGDLRKALDDRLAAETQGEA